MAADPPPPGAGVLDARASAKAVQLSSENCFTERTSLVIFSILQKNAHRVNLIITTGEITDAFEWKQDRHMIFLLYNFHKKFTM
jgi:hypothetical protein